MNDGDPKELDRTPAHRHFIDSIRARTVPWATIEQGRHVSEILFAGYEAAESGQTIELETAF